MARRREAEKLRRELDGVRVRRGTCFRRDLKARATDWIVGRRAEGASVETVAAELGLAPGTVLRWSATTTTSTGSKPGRTQAMIPVRVVRDNAPTQSVTVVSPAGFRIEGLSLAEAAALLRALG